VWQYALALALGSVAAGGAYAQNGPVVVQHIAVVPSEKGLSVQITASRAVKPQLTRLDNPVRIVIDLPGAILPGGLQRIPVRDRDISEVRASQWRESPPIARVVVQLRVAREYSLINSGNKLSLWLLPGTARVQRQQGERLAATPAGGPSRAAPPRAATAPAAPSSPPAYQPAAAFEPLANFETLRGAESVSALGNPTVLRLPRGGEIHVCPGTTLTVTPSKSGRDLMVGLSTGTLETHYTLGAAADVILTPDFRVLLPGPGEFHLAVSADRQGNTCVRALPGDNASAVVSEIMGNDSYQVNAGDQVLFHGGRLQNASSAANLNCGCPLRTIPVMRAATPPPVPAAGPSSAVLAPPSTPPPSTRSNQLNDPLPTAASSAPVQVEAPFVFRATQPNAPDVLQLAQLHFSNGPPPDLLTLHVSGATHITSSKVVRGKTNIAINQKPRGFFGRLRSFFGSVFH
jgi:hypothetical protein